MTARPPSANDRYEDPHSDSHLDPYSDTRADTRAGEKQARRRRPNIIIFITHDQGELLGCYSRPDAPNTVRTPNLDALADEGVRFVNHFCTAPQCSPSRGALQTAKYPHQNGLMGLVNRGWSLPEANTTLPMYLKRAGYTTHLLGFQHESADAETLGYDTVSPRRAEHYYSPQFMMETYEKFLQAHRDDADPFFVSIGTPEVHRPHIIWADPVHPATVTVPAYLPDTPLVRRDLAELYGAVEAVDGVVGRLVALLERHGLRDETLLIYTTDHGIAFPRAKCTLYDPGIKILLVMGWPNAPWSDGRVVRSLVSNIDLLPTLLAIVGADRVDGVDTNENDIADPEGRSYLPILEGETDAVRDAVYAEKTYHEIYHPLRCVRTRRYKYIRNFKPLATRYHLPKDIAPSFTGRAVRRLRSYHRPQPAEELYDLEVDPHERTNLIHEPAYRTVAERMRARLERWMRETDDPLLDGTVPPQKRVRRDYGKIEVTEAMLLPLLRLLERLMRNRNLHRFVTHVAGRFA